MEHASVQVHEGQGSHADLVALAATVSPQQVIVLGYRDVPSVDDADARTLLTLLGLRMIWPAEAADPARIVAELLVQRNLVLAAPAGVDDQIGRAHGWTPVTNEQLVCRYLIATTNT